jgi:small-conductance mechanosensitive channel
MIDVNVLRTVLANAIDALISQLALFLPRLLSALGLLVLGWLVGRLAAGILRRLAKRLGFERRLAGTGLPQAFEQAGLKVEISDVLARLVFWLILLAFGLPAADALGLQAAADGLRMLIGYIPSLIGAILVFVGGIVLARLVGQATQAFATGAGLEVARGLGQAVRYFLFALTFVLAVGQLGFKVALLGDAVINLLTVSVAALGLTFALSGRGVVRNLLAGFYVREIYVLGQAIQVEGYHGTLEAVDTLKATIATDEGQVTVPNSLLIERIVVGDKHKVE